ncbi:MAG TPA: ABC transporter permease [Candidatus Limnocylindrales bacterium]
MILLQRLTRLLAFVGKELVETSRRPGAMLSMVLGPFLIMIIFGAGYLGYRQPLRVAIVVPANADLPGQNAAAAAVPGITILDTTSDQSRAESELTARTVDVVIVFPDDLQKRFAQGQQSTIKVETNLVDPVDVGFAGVLARELASATNQQLIKAVVSQVQQASQLGPLDSFPPDVVAAPTTAEVVNLAPTQPGVVAWFGPAILALVLQHMSVTLISLSLVRERMSGMLELFRLAPLDAFEVILGKVVAFAVLGAVVSLTTLALLVFGLHVPFNGSPLLGAATLGLVLLGSLGIGLVVALISDSERMAVQLSLLVLLATVFFSGFVIKVNEFSDPVQALGNLIPATHGIRLLQDVMLFGWTLEAWRLIALALIAGVTLVASWILLRRSMAPS